MVSAATCNPGTSVGGCVSSSICWILNPIFAFPIAGGFEVGGSRADALLELGIQRADLLLRLAVARLGREAS